MNKKDQTINKTNKAPYIVIEGVDGCGKSTIAKRLAELLNFVVCHEHKENENIPELAEISTKTLMKFGPMSSFDYYCADMCWFNSTMNRISQLRDNWGKGIIGDRSVLSSYVYSTAVSEDMMAYVNKQMEDFVPDATIVLVCTKDTAQKRMESRGSLDDMDQLALENHDKLTKRYMEYAGAKKNDLFGHVIVVGNDDIPVDDICLQILLGLYRKGVKIPGIESTGDIYNLFRKA